MSACTIFKNFANPVEDRSLIIISNWIASEKFKTEVEEIRSLVEQGKTEEASNKKRQLLAFTPSGVFKEKRQLPFLERYTGFLHLDFDKLTPEQLQQAFQVISGIPYTFMCFVSPSGNGLKVFIEVDTGMEHHETAYQQVQKYYEEATGLNTDPSCKDITRLCFMSYDPNLYKNLDYQKFKVQEQESDADIYNTEVRMPIAVNQVQKPSLDAENLNTAFIFNQQIQFTNLKSNYNHGNRNNYLYLLGSNCNRAGLSELDTFQYCLQHFDLPEREIKSIVSSAYKHHRHEHSKYEAQFKKEEPLAVQEQQMSTLPEEIFNTIPGFLRQITDVATSDEERDILLLGSLVTLSVAFPKLIGKYGDNPVNANLYVFISAKASAGKGILIHCRKLIEPIHMALREQAKLLKRQYEVDLQEYNSNKNKDNTMEKPQKPLQKMLFIPANNSATGFLEILSDSDSRGIIFETEGDTLSKAFKSDYGDFSDGFRNAFQHEPISYYRRTDKEYVEIQRPSLSALLSGTPKQIQILIPNAENGLFSRFMFYVMNMKHVWKDVFAANTESGLDVHFEKLGKEFYCLYQNLQSSPEIYFKLTQQQQQKFNQYFEKIQTKYIAIHEDDYIGTVRRLGLTAYRIMMIFSVLRLMDTGEMDQELVCEDIDFQNTLKMIEILLKHSSFVYTQIAQEVYTPKPKNRKEQFLDNLPHEFNRKTYVTIALNAGIPDKTAQRYIKDFVAADLLQNPKHDYYINPAASNPQKNQAEDTKD